MQERTCCGQVKPPGGATSSEEPEPGAGEELGLGLLPGLGLGLLFGLGESELEFSPLLGGGELGASLESSDDELEDEELELELKLELFGAGDEGAWELAESEGLEPKLELYGAGDEGAWDLAEYEGLEPAVDGLDPV